MPRYEYQTVVIVPYDLETLTRYGQTGWRAVYIGDPQLVVLSVNEQSRPYGENRQRVILMREIP